jgi:ABC-2 type transport system permease protein
MIRLLKLEWLKVKTYKAFWILAALFFASIFLVNFIVYNFVNRNAAAVGALITDTPFSFPNVWQTISYVSGFLLFLPAILVIILVAQEFSNRTHRQHVIDGLSRKQFMLAKIYLIVVLSLVFTLSVFFCCIFFGFLARSAFSFTNIQYLFWFFWEVFSYSTLAFLSAVYIKKAGLAIGAFFLYSWIVEKTISSVLNIAGYKSGYFFGNYLPLASVDKLVPIPFAKLVTKEFDNTINLPLLVIFSAIYLGVYYFFLHKKLLKSDL